MPSKKKGILYKKENLKNSTFHPHPQPNPNEIEYEILFYLFPLVFFFFFILVWHSRGRSGGAMVLGKLPVPGRPTDLDYSRARAYCACSGWGCLDIFSLVYHFFFLSPSLWETARYRLKYCLKGPLSPKQPTNQPTNLAFNINNKDNVHTERNNKSN